MPPPLNMLAAYKTGLILSSQQTWTNSKRNASQAYKRITSINRLPLSDCAMYNNKRNLNHDIRLPSVSWPSWAPSWPWYSPSLTAAPPPPFPVSECPDDQGRVKPMISEKQHTRRQCDNHHGLRALSGCGPSKSLALRNSDCGQTFINLAPAIFMCCVRRMKRGGGCQTK